jgi:hypothetical protein
MSEHSQEQQVFEARLKTLLPEEYRDNYEDVQPVSMGSAGLKYAPDGRVAWDEIWGSFCDLAMAGGPPHRGRLLEPATRSDIDLDPAAYGKVVSELCRGVEMVAGLAASPSLIAGWIHVDCSSATMARWLAVAINMENVSAYANGMVLHLPAGPHFRLEKEIKNVITSIAKTAHYWMQHTSTAQHRDVAELFEIMDSDSPLMQAPFSTHDTRGASFEALRDTIAKAIHSTLGLQTSGREYHGWLGVDCLNVRSAIWIMRAMVVSNVLCRREGNLIYLPINPSADPSGSRLTPLLSRAHRLAGAQNIL